ncbi:hypothetical protein DFH08DRAFT_819291 [Mycena albidolilacea]|uniref:Uncharacterized protein n=1 Tax=Mycena albidolilacea TaxID=1033008 RepID=A0AAD6ZF60_9AGAR|nr:hypothetical protein DFH08DRAFT_819291 [Mycena albidolilacea]
MTKVKTSVQFNGSHQIRKACCLSPTGTIVTDTIVPCSSYEREPVQEFYASCHTKMRVLRSAGAGQSSDHIDLASGVELDRTALPRIITNPPGSKQTICASASARYQKFPKLWDLFFSTGIKNGNGYLKIVTGVEGSGYASERLTGDFPKSAMKPAIPSKLKARLVRPLSWRCVLVPRARRHLNASQLCGAVVVALPGLRVSQRKMFWQRQIPLRIPI